MAEKVDAQVRHRLRVPLLLEWKHREQQVDVSRHFVSAAGARRPNLRRNILNELRIPVEENVLPGANVLFDRVSRAAVEAGLIDANDGVGRAFAGDSSELVEQPPELDVFLERLPQADDRVLRQVESQFDSGRGHARSACAEESWCEARVQRLRIRGGPSLEFGDRRPQRCHQFRREQIPAGLPGDEHNVFRPHLAIARARSSRRWPKSSSSIHASRFGADAAPTLRLAASICRVISNARSSARFADSPLTRGVCWARTHSTKCCSSNLSGCSFAIGTGSRPIFFPAQAPTIAESFACNSFLSSELSSASSPATR